MRRDDEVLRILRKVRHRLPGAWHQGGVESDDGRRLSITGHVAAVGGKTDAARHAEWLICKAGGCDCAAGEAYVNDEVCQTEADVLRLVDEAMHEHERGVVLAAALRAPGV